MKWGINQTNRTWTSTKNLKDSLEVFSLEIKELIECNLTFRIVRCKNHPLNDRATLTFKEHVFCAAEANAFSAKLDCKLSVLRRISIGANTKLATELICPGHVFAEITRHHGFFNRNLTGNNFSESAVQGDEFTLFDDLSSCLDHKVIGANADFRTTSNGWDTEATCNECSVRCHSTTLGQNTLCSKHSLEVIWVCVCTNKDHTLAGSTLTKLSSPIR